ncbi:MAG: AAA-like domain-containing protein [Spirochaetota bacterium]
MKFFNTSGPVNSTNHYLIPPLERWDLENVLQLIEQEKYFVLHAPRQTGKTSCLLALADYLNAEGRYKALYVNVEPAQAYRENVEDALSSIYASLARSEIIQWQSEILDENRKKVFAKNTKDLLSEALFLLSIKTAQPVVLFIDEIDSLIGDTLISVLRQLRAGYTQRPKSFPQSIVLCGVRDVRDYRLDVTNSGKEIITGGSAFNIKDESLRLGNFTKKDIEVLYQEHSSTTGQEFEAGYLDLVWDYTGGQPWLANALAYETCFRRKENRDRSRTIPLKSLQQAKENLIIRRDTHLDQLSDKLKEPRVQRIVEPILQSGFLNTNIFQDDIQYCIDLGLLTHSKSGLIIANKIYAEIIPRELTVITQYNLQAKYRSEWYIDKDNGKLQMSPLLTEFQNFYRKHSEHWLQGISYSEAGSQLLLQAFLQRIINGEGIVEREYGLGKRRTDLYICWFPQGKDNYHNKQEIVIECKVLYDSLELTIEKGLQQVSDYADKCGATESHLLIFDTKSEKSWDEKVFQKQMSYQKREIHIWGM